MGFRRKTWFRVSLGVISLLIIMTGINVSRQGAPVHGQQWEMMVSIVTHTLIPLHEQFVVECENFEAAALAFRAHPTPETLDTLQQAWRQTILAWMRAEQIGLERSAPVVSQIYKPPANTAFIEDFIGKNETIDVAFIAGTGSTAKGLAAIEYLIFDPVGGNDAVLLSLVGGPRAAQRMAYLVAAIQYVHLIGGQYTDAWRALGARYADAAAGLTPAEIQDLTAMDLRMMTNKWLAMLEGVVTGDLGDPLGLTSDAEIHPERVKAPRSHYSTQLIIARLQGLKLVFYGRSPDGTEYAGYDDGLDFVDADYNGRPLSQVVGEKIDAAISSLEQIDVPLEDALVVHPDGVRTAYQQVQSLLLLMVADMTSRLSISLTYNDNDGD